MLRVILKALRNWGPRTPLHKTGTEGAPGGSIPQRGRADPILDSYEGLVPGTSAHPGLVSGDGGKC